jgi:hypothetical protein
MIVPRMISTLASKAPMCESPSLAGFVPMNGAFDEKRGGTDKPSRTVPRRSFAACDNRACHKLVDQQMLAMPSEEDTLAIWAGCSLSPCRDDLHPNDLKPCAAVGALVWSLAFHAAVYGTAVGRLPRTSWLTGE